MDINDIARRAGVSRTTVSRYLNNGYVSKDKRRIIAQVIKETGYVPSQNAQQLRTGKSHLVGVIMPKLNSQSVSRMVQGLTSELICHSYHAVLANTENNEMREVDFLRLFAMNSNVDGVVLIATVFTKEHLKALEALPSPVVILGQKLDGYACVYPDDYGAMRDLCRLVLKKSERPAYIGVKKTDIQTGIERRRGFDTACVELGLTVNEDACPVVDFTADAGYFGAERILEVVPDVDTIVCATDDIAFGAMMCMNEYGKRVPEDVQITGIGDSQLSQIARPSLTTAHLYYQRSGIEAARLLVERMENPGKTNAVEVKMGYEVYGRMSMR